MTIETTKKLFKKASDFVINYFDNTKVVSLHQVDIILNEMYAEHEAQLKAKDDKIKKLNHTVNGLHEMFLEAKQENKARSIVAMLFWKARWWDIQYGYGTEQANTYMNAFDKAYAMLKDNK